ncbi:MAG: hypothetical protein FGM25_15690 [Mycobacterium sp.]|nr:hypothetical protein [Mycobacterium sp.]
MRCSPTRWRRPRPKPPRPRPGPSPRGRVRRNCATCSPRPRPRQRQRQRPALPSPPPHRRPGDVCCCRRWPWCWRVWQPPACWAHPAGCCASITLTPSTADCPPSTPPRPARA